VIPVGRRKHVRVLGLGYKVSVNVSRNKSESQSTTQASEAVGSSIVGRTT